MKSAMEAILDAVVESAAVFSSAAKSISGDFTRLVTFTAIAVDQKLVAKPRQETAARGSVSAAAHQFDT